MVIEKLAIDSIRRRRAVTAQQFVNLFVKWEMPGDATTKRVAGQLYKLLTDKRYLPSATGPGPGTNQMDKIKVKYDALGREFVMRHGCQGNVAQALHKDIDRIE